MIDSLGNVDMPRPAESPRRDGRRAMDFEQVLGADASPGTPARDDAAREGNLLEVQVLDRDGQAFAILLPWRLAANGALSQWVAAGDAGAPLTNGSLSQATLRAAMAPETTSGMTSLVSRPPTPSMAPDAPRVAVPMSHAVNASAGAARDVDASASAALQTLVEPWQARLLRWMQQADGGLTARLRDYRLDAADEGRFIERTLAFAREHGLQLQRIVVNAREVWRACP